MGGTYQITGGKLKSSVELGVGGGIGELWSGTQHRVKTLSDSVGERE